MVRVKMEITLPDGFLQALLQDVRNFDMAHDPERKSLVHIAISVEAPNLSAAMVKSIFHGVKPPFENEWVFPSGLGEA